MGAVVVTSNSIHLAPPPTHSLPPPPQPHTPLSSPSPSSSSPRYKSATWMYDLREHIGHFPYNFVRMPGTHNSGSDAINMHSKVTPDAPSILKKCDGTILGLLARQVTVPWAKAQNISMFDQLLHGVRFLDLRIGTNPKYPLTTPPPASPSNPTTSPSTPGDHHHYWGGNNPYHRRHDPTEVRRLAAHHRNRLWLKHSLFSKTALEGLEEIKRFALMYPREIIVVDCRSVDHFNNEDLRLLWNVLLRDTLLPHAIPKSLATMSDTLEHIWNIPTGNPVRNIFLLMSTTFEEWAEMPENREILAEFREYGHIGTSLRNEWHNRTSVSKLLTTMRSYDARIMGKSMENGQHQTKTDIPVSTSSSSPSSYTFIPMSREERNQCMSSCYPFVTGTVITADTETIKSAICGGRASSGSNGGGGIPTSLEDAAAMGATDFLMYFWDMNMPGSEERVRLVQMAQILLAREQRRQQPNPLTTAANNSSSTGATTNHHDTIPSLYCCCNPWNNFICQWCRCNLNASILQLDFVQMGHINSRSLTGFSSSSSSSSLSHTNNDTAGGGGGSSGGGMRAVYHHQSHVLNALDVCIEINLRVSRHPYALRYLKLKMEE